MGWLSIPNTYGTYDSFEAYSDDDYRTASAKVADAIRRSERGEGPEVPPDTVHQVLRWNRYYSKDQLLRRY